MPKKKKQPLCSIVCPFLNEESFLAEAIDSVLSQTFSNWELLLVNDGSVDESPAIAREYASQQPENIRYFEHDNAKTQGISTSRNLAIKHARGDYLAFLDGDDVWLPHKLEVQVELLAEHPAADMIFGPTKLWYSWADRPLQEDEVSDLGTETGLHSPPELLRRLYPLGQGGAPSPTSIIVRSDAAKDVGYFVDGFPDAYEDQAFLTKIYLHKQVYISDQYLDLHRKHSNSISSQVEGRDYHRVRYQFLRHLEQYLRTQPKVPAEIWLAISKSSLTYRYPQLKHAQYLAKEYLERGRKWARARMSI